MVKNLSVSARDTRDTCLIPGLGRSPGGGHGNPLQYSCQENPMDRGAWWATVHRVAELNMTEHTSTYTKCKTYRLNHSCFLGFIFFRAALGSQ